MKIIRSVVVMTVCVLFGSVSFAANQDDHKTHHPEAAANSSKVSKVGDKAASVSKPMAHASMAEESMEKMDTQMKAMQEMHEKMMNAKTPEERKAHMAEHMKAMQGGMAMMNGMSKMCCTQKTEAMPMVNTLSGENKSDMQCGMHTDMEAKHKMMEKRMEMMEAMLQMIIDRVNSESYDDYADRVLKK